MKGTMLSVAMWCACLVFSNESRAASTVIAWGDNWFGQTNVPSGLSDAVSVVAGGIHSLALKGDGTVIAWGAGEATNVPVDLINVVAIAAGDYHSVALKSDGTVVAWGTYYYYGQPNVPVGLTNVVAVATGGGSYASHIVALKSDGTVIDWGEEDYSQTSAPAGLSNVIAVAAGGGYRSGYSLALKTDGSVIAWGNNGYSQTNVPAGLSNVVSISAWADSLAIRSDGTVVGWGNSFYNQTNIPAELSNVVAIASGSFFSLALKTDGNVVAWGFPPPAPSGLSNVVAIAVGGSHGLAIVSDGTPRVVRQPLNRTAYSGAMAVFGVASVGAPLLSYQWQFNGTNINAATNTSLTLTNLQAANAGNYSVVVTNDYGLATSSNAILTVLVSPPVITHQPTNREVLIGWSAAFEVTTVGSLPINYQWRYNDMDIAGATNAILTLTNVQWIHAGNYGVVVSNASGSIASSNAALVIVPSIVAAWGWNSFGQTNVPAGLSNVVAVAGGAQHSLALQGDGTVVGWGRNDFSQLNFPSNLSNVVAITCGADYSAVLKSDGTVVAQGNQFYGVATPPSGLTNLVAIAGGSYHCLALKSDGTVAAWGAGTNSQGPYPIYGQCVVPLGLTNVVAIAGGDNHSLALKSDGTVVAWVDYSNQTNLPAGLSNVVAIAAGAYFNLALKDDGKVFAWGSAPPVPSGLSNVVAIDANVFRCLALKSDGTMVIWGSDTYPSTEHGQSMVLTGLVNVTAIAAGYYHNLVLLGNNPPVLRALLSDAALNLNGYSLSLPTQIGRVYALEYKHSLTDNDWIALPLVAGTGSNLTLIDPVANSSQRFYRVRQW